ncbi:LuxR C-terminal-related transcriptional regulator [Streptomyces sp. NPDC090022]|uniref:LuxR C-terminal-related transcriptional regulator n=1 Tax=Streptomyces sp. NPDC090022 TaxID=3365920 RepID=UPI00381F724C
MRGYERLLAAGSLPASDVPPCLWDLHLVTEDATAPGQAVPVPPEVASFSALHAMESAIAAQQRTLWSTRATLAAFRETYEHSRREQGQLTLLNGAEVIDNALAAAVDGCREELLTAHPGGTRPENTLRAAVARDVRMLRRGVSQRTIYQHTIRGHQPTLAYIERVTEAGAQVRTLTEVFERMIIADRETAFIPGDETDRASSALQIRDPHVVRFLVGTFESAWARATEVRPATAPARQPAVTSELQLAILQAVVGGETDDSIARRLGMSRRTVAEHIRKVSVQLGSGSRAQLGFLLATSELLRPPADGV